MGEDRMSAGALAMRCMRARGVRQLCTAVEAKAAPGGLQVWRPKVKKTTHLSPFHMEVVSSPQKYFKYQANAFVENAPDWVPAVVLFISTVYFGNFYHDKWMREHAMHGGDEE